MEVNTTNEVQRLAVATQDVKQTTTPDSVSPAVALAPPLFLMIASILWFVRPTLGPWPLGWVAAGLIASVWVLRQPLQWTAFDPPLLLFLAAAALGAAIARSMGLPWPKFWEIVSSLVLFRAILLLPAQVRLGKRIVFSPWRWLFGLLPVVIALFFVLTNDWTQWSGKMAWIDAAGRTLSRWSVSLPSFLWIRSASGASTFHPNVAGGLIAVLLPLQLAALLSSRLLLPRMLLAGAIAVSAAGLVLTGSRGAWMALALAIAIWMAWEMSKRWPAQLAPTARRLLWLVLVLVAAVVGLFFTATLCGATCREAVGGRLVLLQNSLALALDTPFTGLGLGGEHFEMAYSSYVLLLHVGFAIHSHNLALQILLEQGILGLIALAWIIVVVLTRRGPFSLWQKAAYASFAVILLHGLVDIPLYTGRGVHLLFLPLAVMVSPGAKLPTSANHRMQPGAVSKGELAVAVALLVGLVWMFLPSSRAALQANLGALAQTRAELARYTWPAWPIQDELRRSPEIDLGPAIARYQAALAESPVNATANRRLGQIELSRGDYEAARGHLEQAYATRPDDRATRQLLGESYAIAGDASRAAALWRTVDTSLQQLDLRVFWYEHIGELERVEQIRMAEAKAEDSGR